LHFKLKACGFGAADDDLRVYAMQRAGITDFRSGLGDVINDEKYAAGLQRIEYGLRHCWHICRTHEGIVEVMEIEGRPNQIERFGRSELVDWPRQYAHVGVSGIMLKGTGSGGLFRSAILQLLFGQEGVDVAFFADDTAQDPREVSTCRPQLFDLGA
jgi:hypothetical protein